MIAVLRGINHSISTGKILSIGNEASKQNEVMSLDPMIIEIRISTQINSLEYQNLKLK